MLRISKQCAILTNATTTKRFSTPTTLFNWFSLQGITAATTTTTTTSTTLNVRQFTADAATKSNNSADQQQTNASSSHSPQNRGPSSTTNNEQNDEQEILLKLKQTFQNDINSGGIIPIYKKALLYGNKVAIKDSIAEYSYAQLYNGAKQLAIQISNICGSGSSSKVAFLCTNNAVYTLIQWACWFSGQIAVPLNPRHPSNILEYYVKDSDAQLLITIPEYEKCMNGLAKIIERQLIIVDHTIIPSSTIIGNNTTTLINPKQETNIIQLNNDQLIVDGTLDGQFYAKSDAMIVYTSGSTGKPKGVMITHRNLDSQLKNLTHAWQINDKDSMLHVLPLNHIHGIVNALMCPLSVGAKVFMQSQFESHSVWSALLNVNMPTKDQITLFMGVPTIYSLLITEFEKTFSKNERMVDYIRSQCEKRIRLMISGSAPLPVTVFNRWHEITGHKLLERYGMTEIGMVLSNPYVIDKIRGRIPGSVGLPLPDAEIKLVHDDRTLIEMKGESNKNYWSMDKVPVDGANKNKSTIDINVNHQKINTTQSPPLPPTTPPPSGELYVRGPMVFREYYKKPNETKGVFDENGWFKTGDEVKYENGVFKVMGRKSVDIIKTGGYKVSALEIETHLMEHSAIADVCVIGVPDDVWGQRIAALIVCKDKSLNEIPDFPKWCEKQISAYQIPTIIKIIDEIPRNAMGKINKKEILIEFFPIDTKNNKLGGGGDKN